MKLTTIQMAALTSALSHPNQVISATPQTAAALERRGLVVGRKLTPSGLEAARELDTSHIRCGNCAKMFPSITTLPSDGRDMCPDCMKAIGYAVVGGRTWSAKRMEFNRKGKEMEKLEKAGHWKKDTGRKYYR